MCYFLILYESVDWVKAVISLFEFDKISNGTIRMWSKASSCSMVEIFQLLNIFVFVLTCSSSRKKAHIMNRAEEFRSNTCCNCRMIVIIKQRNSNTDNCDILWVDFFSSIQNAPFIVLAVLKCQSPGRSTKLQESSWMPIIKNRLHFLWMSSTAEQSAMSELKFE